MPISTEFIRFCKGVEQFYYVIAIASEPDPDKAAAAWRAWLANGLNPAVRLAPPVDGANRIKVDSRPGVGGFDLTISGANREALERLRMVLEEVDAAHKSLDQRGGDEARVAALMEIESRGARTGAAAQGVHRAQPNSAGRSRFLQGDDSSRPGGDRCQRDNLA